MTVRSKAVRLPLLALLATTALLAPASAAEKTQTYSEATSVVVVEVPVNVVRDGQPVRGLTQANFEIYDGRKKLDIIGFDAIDLQEVTTAQRSVTEVPTAARRHFMLLFDLMFSDLNAIDRARAASIDFVRDQMHPTDLASVVLFGSRGAQLVLGFTSDRRQIELALQTLGAPKLIEINKDPLNLVLSQEGMRIPGQTGSADPASGDAGGKMGGEVMQYLQEIGNLAANQQRGAAEAEVTAMSRSFADIARMISTIDGKKHVIYFSEGFDSSLLTGTAGLEQNLAQTDALASGDFLTTSPGDTQEQYGSTKLQKQMEAMLKEFVRADATIQAVNIGKMAAGGEQRGRANGEDGLVMMAKDTGGEVYRNFNDLGEAMGELTTRTSVTYLITVEPPSMDGKFHDLKVKLVNVPKADVFARQGYYAPDEKGQKAPAQQTLDLADQILGGEPGGALHADVLAAAFPTAQATAFVPVLIEVDGPKLLEGTAGDSLPTQLYAYAIDKQGTIVGYFAQTLGLDLSKLRSGLAEGGLKFFGHLDLPPGDYSLRVLVRNAVNFRTRLAVVPLRVPDFASEQAVSMPLSPAPTKKWLLQSEPDLRKFEFPFMLAGQAFIPAAHPVVPASGEMQLQVVGYNFGPQVQVSGKLTAADGREVSGAGVALVSREDAPRKMSRLLTSLKTSGVAAGEYTLTVTVTDAATGKAETSAIPVRVG